MTIDVAIDPAGPRLLVYRISGNASGEPGGQAAGIYGVLLNRNGSARLAGPFRLDSAGSTSKRNPRVAFDGSSYLVVWEDAGRIEGRRFSASGAPLGAEIAIAEGGRNARVAASKFKDMPHFHKPPLKGHICLQDHTARIEYRNIKLRPLRER